MAPHLYNSPLVHEQDDAAFLEILRLISFSGTRALIEDAELRSALFPVLRADFRAVVEYGNGFTPRAPLRSPISGFAADNDLFAAPKAMEAWSSYTDQAYELAQLPGDHYFVESDRATVTSIVGERLARSLQLTAPSAAAHPHVRYQRPSEQTMGQPPRASSIRRIAHERSSAERPVRVWCFPPVGVLASELRLPGASPSELIYTPFEWRVGSGARRTRSVPEMVDRAYAATLDSPQQPTLFYGHCLGAIVAYELALRLQKEGRSMPAQLIVAGTVGPHLYVAPDAHKLPDEKLLELLTVLKYPLVQRLTDEPTFAGARLPEIRADLEAMASYQYLPDERLTIPITAISFRHDLWSYPLRTESWRIHSHASCEVLEWPGDHYYALHNPGRIDELVKSVLMQPLAAE
jgi:surfactin synthase thioesterase subunit